MVRITVRHRDADIVVRVVLYVDSLTGQQARGRQARETRAHTEYEFSSFSLEPVARMLGE